MVAHKFAVLCSVSTLALVSACSAAPPRSGYGGTAPGVAFNATQKGVERCNKSDSERPDTPAAAGCATVTCACADANRQTATCAAQ